MRRFAAYALLCLALGLAAGPAPAQEEGEDGGFLERLIEGALSGDDRDVVIRGFEGLLAGRARFDTMTISDADGIWLTVTNAELDWNRLALLRSRLVVSNLTAESIDFPRLPLPAAEPPAPEAASGFSLPDLPVAVRVDAIGVDRLSLGEPLFGQAATLSVAGSAVLENGEGTVALQLDRTDGVGTFALDGSYANTTGVLSVSLLVDEAADGIVANLVNLPGLPSVRLEVTGEGPLSDYAADIRLATDGADRLTGRVTLTGSGDAVEPDRSFTAQLSGDVTPLFLPEYQDFFGDALVLDVAGTRRGDGALDLDRLSLQAQSLTLSGALSIGPQGLPVFADIDARIVDAGGDPVVLPVPGKPVQLSDATFAVKFDAARGQRWDADLVVNGLASSGYSVGAITLEGGGDIQPVSPGRGLTADFDFRATEVDLGDDAVDAALGEDVTGSARLVWTEGAPLIIRSIDVQGATYGLTASGEVGGFGSGLDLDIDAAVEARDLSAFSGLAGRSLGGAIAAEATVTVEALTGQAAVLLSGTSRDLLVDQPEADRVLAGSASFDIWAVRDENGTRLERFVVASPNAQVTAKADLKTGASTVTLDAELTDTSLVVPDLAGPSRVVAQASQDAELWTFDARASVPGSSLAVAGTGDVSGRTPRVDAQVNGTLGDLSRFAALANRPLAGGIALNGDVSVTGDLADGSVDLTGVARDLAIGQPQVDALLAGATDFAIKGALSDGVPTLDSLTLRGRNLQVDGGGSLAPGAGALTLSASIAEVGAVLPGAQGAFAIRAVANEGDGRVWSFDVQSDGALVSLDAQGEVTPFASPIAIDTTLDLTAPDMSLFSALAGRSLGGSVAVSGKLSGTSDLKSADVDLRGSTTSLSVGIAEVDRLLRGQASFVVNAQVVDGDTITLREVQLTSPELNVSATGSTTGGVGRLDVSAALSDLGIFVPDFAGRATVDGSATLSGSNTIALDLAATGPGGISATVAGSVQTDTQRLDLAVRGNAPLGLANRFLTPNSIDGTVDFNLAIQGPPALESVSGRISSAGARLVLPGPRISLQNIAVNADLSGGSVSLSVDAGVEAGGRITVNGPIALTPPFNGSLDVALNSVVLIDPTLYQTSLSGNLSMNGPLAGGASIAGDIRVGETEISIAGTGAGASGPIPEIEHRNEPFDVYQTRRFAGLVRDERRSGAGGPAYPLDVSIDVQRVFVRGRGLDAELAGGLRVRGTTADVIPVGEINLIRGRLNILGARLRVDEGAILLQGALVPVLRMRAVSERRTSDDVTAFVSIDGPVTDPEITFESEPPLPEDEVLALLLFGTDLANISPLQAAQLANAAATLAGRGGPGVIGGIRDGLGIDDLDVTTDEEGNTAVTAGAYINDNLYADVTTRSNGETEVNLNFTLTDSIRVTGSTDNTGESSIGLFFQRDY